MKIDYYRNYKTNVADERPKDVAFYLERIRSGKHKDLINAIRSELDKTKKNELKSKLSAVTFAGTFSRRQKTGLKKASGLAIFDVDNCDIELKKQISEDKYTFACWVSPSGNGLKFLVKIPIVKDNEEYLSYWLKIVEHYSFVEIDSSGQDISRLCFESYDENIYINLESETFKEYVEREVFAPEIGIVTNIPIQDQDEIANRLMIWFKKWYDGTNRNNSFFKLASAFNDFGVSEIVAERYILPNQQKDFTASEIRQLIRSAFKNKANHGTKFFEDKQTYEAVRGLVTTGKSNKEIIEKFEHLDREKLENEIEIIKENINVSEFWYYDERGKMQLSAHQFKFYLEHKNYFKHYPVAKSKTFVFVKKDEHFVDEVFESQIKDDVLNNLLDSGLMQQFDMMAKSSRNFSTEFLSILSNAEFNVEEDTKETAMLYYQNTAVKVFKDQIQPISYEDLGGFVWKKQVIDRDFIEADHHESEFRTFIWLCSNQDKDNYNSMKSVIGYLLHSYKTSANNRAIIFNDETVSDNPNGGSGKSLFWNALSHVKKVASIDGKTFEFTKSFPYQSVPTDTQLLVFDDVKKNFNFENLFSLITEGITLEYKGQDAIKLPVTKSPKIIITTNYTIGGVGGSFERRKFELEMSSYFSANHSPLDEFGHMLFDDWDLKEWARFDHFMINCLKFYLANGLVDFKHKSLGLRKLINETNSDFLDWIKENLVEGTRITKKDFYQKFIDENTDFKQHLKQKRFTIWLQTYAKHYDKPYTDGSSNGVKWFTIGVETEKIDDICPF